MTRRISKKRRKEQKTNYAKRLKLLKGKMPRIVFRKTNRYLIAQYIKSVEAQDKIEITLNSRELLKYNFPKEFSGSLKSTPAAYLLGLLMGKKIPEKKAIVDFGMNRVIHKNRLFAFIKGLTDSGVKINCKKEAFPNEDRIKGKHLKKDFSKNFEEIKGMILKEK